MTGELTETVLEMVGDRAEAQVTVARQRSGLTRFANSFIHQHVGEETTAVELKVAAGGGRVATTSTTDTRSERALRRFVDETVELAKLRPPDPDWPGLAPPQDVPGVDHADEATLEAEPDARAGLVADFVEAGEDLSAAGYVDTDGLQVSFANSAGHRAAGRATRATVDGIHQTRDSAGAAHQTSRALADLDAAAAGDRAADLARRSREPVDIDPGVYEVVLSPECAAEIVAFLAIYGFNAKQHLEGQSFARPGEAQFDTAVALWDDATDPRALGLPLDHEGTAKARLDLVSGGVTQGLAHDRRTARRAGVESTGHAIPGGDVWGPVPTNLFLAAADARAGDGGTPVQELVAGVDKGLLVTEFNYCRILDPKSQEVTGLTRNGTFLIESGEVTRPVTNLRFTQSFLKALAPGNVLGVGDDARFAECEFGAGMVVAPSLRLAEWHFTGGARG